MLYTVYHGREYLAESVRGGVSSASPLVLKRLNECQSRLLRKGDWDGSNMLVRFATDKNYITLPECVAAVRGVTLDGVPWNIQNRAYQFIPNGVGEFIEYMAGRTLVEATTSACTSMTMPETPVQLIALSPNVESGKTIRLMGRTLDGKEIYTDGVPGEELLISTWRNGIEGSIHLGTSHLTTNLFSDLSIVLKPATSGYVTLLGYIASTGKTYFLSHYRPDELNPRYVRYKITGQGLAVGTSIMCNCKMAHVPLYNDDDVLIVQNLDAMKDMSYAIESYKVGDIASGKEYETRAYGELVAEQADKIAPNNAVTVECGSGMNVYNMV